MIKFKLNHPNAKIPTKATEGAAGYDLTVVSFKFGGLASKQYVEYDTGVIFEFDTSKVGLLFPRSSCSNKGLSLANSVGVIDSDFRDSVKLRYYFSDTSELYGIGQRAGQILIMNLCQEELTQADILEFTKRGEGGFGSSGV
jgi:dUTP pyrophosphatase